MLVDEQTTTNTENEKEDEKDKEVETKVFKRGRRTPCPILKMSKTRRGGIFFK